MTNQKKSRSSSHSRSQATLPQLTINDTTVPSFLQWFCNLPIGRQQLIALFVAEFVSIVGLSIGARWIITTGWRAQLLYQARSELTVTENDINRKVSQTGVGFQTQSETAAIVEAAKIYATSRTLPTTLRDAVKQILQNEIKTQKIDEATLVGKDFRIIVDAKTNGNGEIFNPNNLVRQVFTNSKQIKANAIVKSAFDANQDTLVRYIITPVKDPDTKTVSAVLVSGDIVNGKLPIMAGILKDFGGGYSGVYLRKPTGEFALATSLDQDKTGSLEQAQPNVTLNDPSLLTAAVAHQGQIVTRRMVIGTQTYTMAAKAIPNRIIQEATGSVPTYSGKSVTVLVRGTPETTLNELLNQSLLQEVVMLLLALLMTGIWALILRRAIIKPIKHLGQATQDFTRGDRSSRAKVFSRNEVGQLAVNFNQMADSIEVSEATLTEQADLQTAEARRLQIFTNVTLRIRQFLNLEDIFKTTVKEVRSALSTERVVIYCFNPDWSGNIVAESVAPGWTQALNKKIDDSCFKESELTVEQYKNGRVVAINNIYQAGLTKCYIKFLERFEVKSSLVASILRNNQLLGLMIAHHCSAPHAWRQSEIDLFMQLAIQVGFAVDQANLLEQVEQAYQKAGVVSQEQRQQKEDLQRQLMELLSNVEDAARGDLTVRAEVTAGEIGTVADFFNAIIESLRRLVTQVKTATSQVNVSVGENEGAIRQLADAAFKQAEEIMHTLDSVEQMTLSIQAVADSARQAAKVARTASTTAMAGEVAMDRTVQSILNLRETVAETANKVKRLGESSQQISKVVSLINQIALQTNLLSINASIEAARAGKQGWGFAVVAEEVGQLAADSAAATKEIEQIVANIQSETNEVVRAMEMGTTQVVEGTYLVKDAKQSLGQILDVSRQIDQLVQSISIATVSQAQTSQAVVSLMKDIANVSEHTSDSSRQVSSSLQQTVEVAQQLQASVSVFKTGA